LARAGLGLVRRTDRDSFGHWEQVWTSDAPITMSAIWRSGVSGSGRPTNPCVTRRANHSSSWSSIRPKNIPLLFSCKSVHSCGVPPDKRGGSRSSRNARWDAVAAMDTTDERDALRTAKSCGPGAAMLASSFTSHIVERRWQESPFTGGARSKP
jgi:hypothetical protein